jgi:hypothetical protein
MALARHAGLALTILLPVTTSALLRISDSGRAVTDTNRGPPVALGKRNLRNRRMVSHTPMSSPSITPRKAAIAGAILALVQMFLALRSRTSSLMPVTSRYLW